MENKFTVIVFGILKQALTIAVGLLLTFSIITKQFPPSIEKTAKMIDVFQRGIAIDPKELQVVKKKSVKDNIIVSNDDQMIQQLTGEQVQHQRDPASVGSGAVGSAGANDEKVRELQNQLIRLQQRVGDLEDRLQQAQSARR
jgi:hypothetical protein